MGIFAVQYPSTLNYRVCFKQIESTDSKYKYVAQAHTPVCPFLTIQTKMPVSLRATLPLRRTAQIPSLPLPRPQLHHNPLQLSRPTQHANLSTTDDKTSKKASEQKPNPTMGDGTSYSNFFKEHGASRTTKLIVIGAISIVGTMESIFWIKTVWRWWSPPPEGEENVEMG